MTLGKAEKGPGSVTKEGSHVGSVQEVKIEKGIAGGETRMSRGTKERVGLARSSPMTAAQGVWEGSGVETGLGLLRRMEKGLARPISKAEELSFYPAGDK